MIEPQHKVPIPDIFHTERSILVGAGSRISHWDNSQVAGRFGLEFAHAPLNARPGAQTRIEGSSRKQLV